MGTLFENTEKRHWPSFLMQLTLAKISPGFDVGPAMREETIAGLNIPEDWEDLDLEFVWYLGFRY